MTREAFALSDVVDGDVVRYPAILRREHGDTHGAPLVVAEVASRGLRCLRRVGGDKQEVWIHARQLEENGVLIDAHVVTANSQSVSHP